MHVPKDIIKLFGFVVLRHRPPMRVIYYGFNSREKISRTRVKISSINIITLDLWAFYTMIIFIHIFIGRLFHGFGIHTKILCFTLYTIIIFIPTIL